MRFKIRRYSDSLDKPVPEAFTATVIERDSRTYESPEEFHAGEAAWYGEGENHRVECGRIVRDVEADVWAVAFRTPQEIAAFVDDHYPVSIKRSTFREPVWLDMDDPVYEMTLYDTNYVP